MDFANLNKKHFEIFNLSLINKYKEKFGVN